MGGTGATNAGIGSSFSTLSPTLYVGKGFGELPDALNWAKPFAVTFEASYDIPTSSFDLVAGTFIPQTVSYSASLQYSLPYLRANVIDLGLPDFFNHLIPVVEVSFVTPVANNFGDSFVTTGFISPGVMRLFPGRRRSSHSRQQSERQWCGCGRTGQFPQFGPRRFPGLRTT